MEERLTKKVSGCFCYDLKDHKNVPGEFASYDAFFDYNMAVKRLGEYEDTGLEPQTISEILDSVSEWYDAHKEGRLVVLPCKVGDTLYEIDLPEYGVIVCKVMWMILKNDVSVQVEVTDGHGLGSGYCFELSDFGKTVFLTREAAETARKEREGK